MAEEIYGLSNGMEARNDKKCFDKTAQQPVSYFSYPEAMDSAHALIT